MKNFSISLLLICWLITPGFSQIQETAKAVEPAPDYIRYQKSEDGKKPDRLETAISTFTKGQHSIDLVAVVHLADDQYFQDLTKSLEPYEAVLYEMVGGPFTEEKARQAKATAEGELGQIQGLQQMIKDMFGLKYQLDGINYLAPNFVHADMTIDQYLEHADGNIMSDMLGRAMKLAQSGQLQGVPNTEAESNQMMLGMLGAFMSGDSNALKRVLGPLLADAESLITQLEGEGDQESVIIGKRNKIVMDAIAKLPTDKKRHDAVLYGAGHMPDIEKRLLELGYTKTTTSWKVGWTIPQGPAKSGKAPDLGKMLEQIGGLMENANQGK